MPCDNYTSLGLSPLARGTPVCTMRSLSLSRFIPAGAGNTKQLANMKPYIPVYPRWRGEHASIRTFTFTVAGLSPLARGTLSEGRFWLAAMRFIPAGAGNTQLGGSGFYFCCGLSPLARGTLSLLNLGFDYWRFIPAGAGNTPAVLAAHYSTPVYPRWRGEHGLLTTSTALSVGLSPLARGTRQFAFVALHTRRFIPAGAGNTCPCYRQFSSGPVYPRWRGEHNTDTTVDLTCDGLSPLARGTH